MSSTIEAACRAAYDAEDPHIRGDYRTFRNGFYAAVHGRASEHLRSLVTAMDQAWPSSAPWCAELNQARAYLAELGS